MQKSENFNRLNAFKNGANKATLRARRFFFFGIDIFFQTGYNC